MLLADDLNEAELAKVDRLFDGDEKEMKNKRRTDEEEEYEGSGNDNDNDTDSDSEKKSKGKRDKDKKNQDESEASYRVQVVVKEGAWRSSPHHAVTQKITTVASVVAAARSLPGMEKTNESDVFLFDAAASLWTPNALTQPNLDQLLEDLEELVCFLVASLLIL